MPYIVFILLFMSPLFMMLSCAVAHENDEPVCTDFLQEENVKPKELKFIECSSDPVFGLKALTAEYQVAGPDIAAVEAWIMRLGKVTKLKFACCGWETGPGRGFTGRSGRGYQLSMGGETPIASRSRWGEIPYLSVSVRFYLEDP